MATVTETNFSGNSATSYGGAVVSVGTSGAVSDSSFEKNEAGEGGAFYANLASWRFVDSEFRGNSASDDYGDIVYNVLSIIQLQGCSALTSDIAQTHAVFDMGATTSCTSSCEQGKYGTDCEAFNDDCSFCSQRNQCETCE